MIDCPILKMDQVELVKRLHEQDKIIHDMTMELRYTRKYKNYYKGLYREHRERMDEYEEMEYLERENKELKDEIKGYKEENTRLYNGNNRLYNDNIRLAREIKELGGN